MSGGGILGRFGIGRGRGTLTLKPGKFRIQGEQITFGQHIIRGFPGELIDGSFHEKGEPGSFSPGNQIVSGLLLKQSGRGAGGDHIHEQKPWIQKEIGPLTPGGRRRIGGMRNIPGDACHIPGCKENTLIAGKAHDAALRLADADFQTVVKMKAFLRHIGKLPLLAGEKENREFCGQKIVSVFYDMFFCF